jgi:hypothetical protein
MGRMMNQTLPFKKVNYLIFALAVVFLILGFVLSGYGKHDGFMSLTLSPVLLVIAYVVLIPVSILWRPKGD